MIYLKRKTNLQKDIKNTKVNLYKEFIKGIVTSIISIPLISGLLYSLGYNDLVLKYSYIIIISSILPNIISFQNKRQNYKESLKEVKDLREKLKENDISISLSNIRDSKVEENNLENKKVVTYYEMKNTNNELVVLKEISKYLHGIKRGRLYLLENLEEIENEYTNTLKLN